MKTTLTQQQISFYTKNGYLELDGLSFDPNAIFSHASGYDLWRGDPKLHALLTRKLAPHALALSGKDKLHLACDGLLYDKPNKACPLNDLLSFQGLAIAFAIGAESPRVEKRSPLGILPLPSSPTSVLFFRPNLILDWPNLPKGPLYFGAYALSSAVYVHNPKDPRTSSLKQFGYVFGDLLKNEFHPLILK